jgi:hypothetical protein
MNRNLVGEEFGRGSIVLTFLFSLSLPYSSLSQTHSFASLPSSSSLIYGMCLSLTLVSLTLIFSRLTHSLSLFLLPLFFSLSLTLSLSFCVICTCGKSRGKQLQMRPGSFRKEPADSDERGVIKRVPVSMPDIHLLSFSSVF